MNKLVAICYDFDKTLSPTDMQAQGLLQSFGYHNVDNFWEKSDNLTKDKDIEGNLSYMYLISEEFKQRGLKKADLINFGKQLSFYNGVEEWFGLINEYGKERGLAVEHYVLSSGLKEMVIGSKIVNNFTAVYASEYLYDENGYPVWPAQVINYTNKTQFLFRISKGIKSSTSLEVNDYMRFQDLRIPFKNMIYIGDSATDIPCMRILNNYEGHAIGVYDEDKGIDKKVESMFIKRKIEYAPANYKKDGELYNKVTALLDGISRREDD